MDWVPRSVRSRAREIERAIAQLEAKLHRAPTDEEIAEKLGIEGRSSRTACSTSRAPRSPRSTSSGRVSSSTGDQVALIDTHRGPRGGRARGRARRDRDEGGDGEAIARLPEREKLVVTLYYYEELTLREIGEVLGVTESRVSQLHTKAILRLTARLSGAASQKRQRPASLAGLRLPRHTAPEEGFVAHACLRSREDPQRRRRRPPRDREDVARRGDALPVRRDEPARHRRGGQRPSPTGTRTSNAGRCRSRPRSATPSGRTARSTSSTRPATPASRPTRSPA